ncbi:MAG: Hsp20/alpha crystallin family protein [Gemmatimonadota bacterium]|nr:Hsp20/alpha crystallin family protein [Gemmatimonadota bacterium]MDH4347230.1 Hsp20/alpha crystallin family protein [Gemmatimonadota bacterium]MDH5284461.1 Hsp20/alpha crystallin family protein [Gemmatimonadota bacterium]
MKLAKLPVGLPTMTRDIEEVFDRFFNAPQTFPGLAYEPMRKVLEGTWMPVLDFTETEKEFLLRVEVPGVPRENLDVHLEGDVITLTGHREKVIKEEKENILWAEREAGKFLRTIRLPKAVEANKIEAVYADGVLTVRLPKVETAIKNKILIKG